jgi:hypothetical protein
MSLTCLTVLLINLSAPALLNGPGTGGSVPIQPAVLFTNTQYPQPLLTGLLTCPCSCRPRSIQPAVMVILAFLSLVFYGYCMLHSLSSHSICN